MPRTWNQEWALQNLGVTLHTDWNENPVSKEQAYGSGASQAGFSIERDIYINPNRTDKVSDMHLLFHELAHIVLRHSEEKRALALPRLLSYTIACAHEKSIEIEAETVARALLYRASASADDLERADRYLEKMRSIECGLPDIERTDVDRSRAQQAEETIWLAGTTPPPE